MISVQFQCSDFTISPSPYDPQQTPFLHILFLPTLVSLVMRFSLVSLTWGKMGWQAMTCGSGMAFHKKDSWWQLLSMVHARWTEKLPEVPSFDARSAQNIRGWSTTCGQVNFHVQFIQLHAKIAAVEIYGVLILGNVFVKACCLPFACTVQEEGHMIWLFVRRFWKTPDPPRTVRKLLWLKNFRSPKSIRLGKDPKTCLVDVVATAGHCLRLQSPRILLIFYAYQGKDVWYTCQPDVALEPRCAASGTASALKCPPMTLPGLLKKSCGKNQGNSQR